MEYVQTQNKIRILFKKIIEPGYVMNNYYADQLIDKLYKCSSDPEIAFHESVPLISDLISKYLTTTCPAHISVKVFLVRILAIVSHVELHFVKLFAQNGESLHKYFSEITSPTVSPSLRVAFMELALALSHHDSGASWLIETGIWKLIIGMCNEKQTIFVIRQAYKFAAKFLWRLNDMGDTANLELVIGHIIQPIIAVDFLKVVSISLEKEEQMSKTIEPMIHMLLLTITEKQRIQQPNLLINILLKNCNIMSHLYIILDRMRREETILLLTKLLSWLVIAKTFSTKPVTPDATYTCHDLLELGVLFLNTLHQFVKRRSATLVLDFCNNCNLSIVTAFKGLKFLNEGKVQVQNQSLFLCLMPTLVYACEFKKCLSDLTNEGLDNLILRMLKDSCPQTARCAYSLRDLLKELDVLAMTLHSVKRLTCLKAHFNDEQANIVFQALYYVLAKFDPTESGSVQQQCLEDCQDTVNVMTYVLDIVLYLLNNYNIHWRESLEVVCLYTVVNGILKRPNLTCKFIVVALNVMGVTIRKFLHPNMFLLLEAPPGGSSSLEELGQLLFQKLHDRNWEVRDSALELLLACIEISYIKFPPFQKQISDNKLINMATTLLFNDGEFYVQASALKCIGAASKISLIWEPLVEEYPAIQEQMVSILRNNQEGIARKEACNVLCDMYQNLKLSQTFKQTLYEHMVSSALADFHWEVQLSALKFWKMVVQSLLTDQGMLDGTFPPVTFSRETRKIVTLNEYEIQKRLLRALDELSSIGCLTVLVKLLQEDIDIDIMEAAYNISTELLEILNQYKVPEILKPCDNEIASVDELIGIMEEDVVRENIADAEPMAASDNVIEGILNSDDMNLLSNIYDRHMALHGPEPLLKTKPKIKFTKSASPYFFVNFLKSKDFKAELEHKKSWKVGIRSLSSLLDDILGIYEISDGEINSMDCY